MICSLRRVRTLFMAGVLSVLIAAPHVGRAQDNTANAILDTNSALDPSHFVRLTLEPGHRVLYDPDSSGREQSIPARGVLRVGFKLKWMWDHWSAATRASISIRGSIAGADGASRAVEIPEYSVIGQAQKVASLDVAAATSVQQLIQQGGRFAHRVLGFALESDTASLRRQSGVVKHQTAAADTALHRTLDVLARVYALARSNNLIPRDVEAAATEMDSVERNLGGFPAALKAARDSEVVDFFNLLSSQTTSISQWLQDLTSPQYASLLDVVGLIVGRNPDILTANARDFDGSIKQVQAGGLTLDGQKLLAGRLRIVAGEIVDLERDLFFKMQQMPEGTWKIDSATVRLEQEWPAQLKNPGDIVYFADDVAKKVDSVLSLRASPSSAHPSESLLTSSHLLSCDTISEKKAESASPDNKALTDSADAAARAFFSLVAGQTGSGHLGPAGQRLLDDLKERLAQHAQLKDQGTEIAKRACQDSVRMALADSVMEANVIVYNRSILGVVLLLREEILRQLIDRVEPTYINLSSLGLQIGDRLVIDVGTTPPRDSAAAALGHRPWEFEVVRSGWSGILPTVTDGQFFARATMNAEHNSSLRSGVTAVWNYYGCSNFMRTLAPGFGFAALFLQFGNQHPKSDSTHVSGSPFQFGIGPVVTFFNNALQVTYGWNLQSEAVLTDSSNNVISHSRRYWAIGVSVQQIIEKIAGK